jgi:cytochrome d ubiquinol oxidase subunit II
MEILWFYIVAFMLAMYVILDGFDLGAGIIHLVIARSDEERRTILNAIGPVWDGNEVWLIAAGGTLYFAFPLLYASGFSGFYLPLMIALWLFMLRGLGIEFRHHVHNPVWKSLWDVVFSFSSILLTIIFGAALGNVIRGVPLDQSGYFFLPLWTTFTVVPEAGVLDWYTVLMGLVALCTLTAHGANYITLKTEGVIQEKSRSLAAYAWWGILITSILALVATTSIRPALFKNFSEMPFGYFLPILGVLGIAGMAYYRKRKRDKLAFISSSVFIAGMLGATVFGVFPVVLPASTDPQYALTIYNTAAERYGLSVGLVWWIFGIILTTGYFVFIYRIFRGKVKILHNTPGY